MIFRIIPLLLILCMGCQSASKTAQMKAIAEDNKDVVVLSYLIRDYMLSTRRTNFTIEDVIKKDTLGRIAKNFSSIEIGYWSNTWYGGYAVYFKFADRSRKDSIKLTPDERIPWKVKVKKEIGTNETQLAKEFDGEIHFHYPERLYHITEIIVKKTGH